MRRNRSPATSDAGLNWLRDTVVETFARRR